MDSVLDLAMRALAPAMDFCPLGENDYQLDGITYCALCHTPRQMWLEVLGERRLVRILCACKAEELDAAEREDKRRKHLARVLKWREQGIADKAWHGCAFELDDRRDPKASLTCRRYADNFDAMLASDTGLLLYGGVGSGKTYLAACIANLLLEEGRYIMMANLPGLISSINADYGAQREGWLDRIARAHLLILDDFGVERSSEYATEQAYEIINARYKTGRPLIVTSNLSLTELKEEQNLGKRRIYDRVIEKCLPVLVSGDSRRRGIAAQKRADAAELLENESRGPHHVAVPSIPYPAASGAERIFRDGSF